MNSTTTEQKLRLIQQIRSRYRENRYDMYNREQILYGRAAYPDDLEYGRDTDGSLLDEPGYPEHVSGFRIRLFLAALLFAALVAMDVNGITIGSISAEKVMEVISVDYEEKIDEWVEAVSRSSEK